MSQKNIRFEFGAPATKIKEVSWWKDVMELPKIIKFQGDFWEWIAYDTARDGRNDYVVYFSKIKDQGQFTGLEVRDFESMFYQHRECECGAIYNRHFPNIHSDWCPKWEKV